MLHQIPIDQPRASMLIRASQLIYMYSDRTTLMQSGAKSKSGGLKNDAQACS